MAKFRSELPKTAMNRMLEKGLKRLRSQSLLESIQLQVRAKLLTQEEADAIQAKFTPEELAAKPASRRNQTAPPSTPPTNAS